MAPISQDLSRLTRAAGELNALADDVTAQIRALDEVLAGASLGVEYNDPWNFHSGRELNSTGHRSSTAYRLAYGRPDDDNKFSLMVVAHAQVTTRDGGFVRDEDSEIESEVVWSRRLDKVSRSMRLQAIKRLPDFLSGLASHTQEAVASARKGLHEVKAVADELRTALATPTPGTKESRTRSVRTIEELTLNDDDVK